MNTGLEQARESDTRTRRNGDAEADPSTDPRPIGEIASDIWQKAETLLQQELKLAVTDAQERLEVMRREVDAQVTALKAEAVAKATGGAVVFVGGLALTAALILGLAEVIDPWLAALIVGVAVTGIGVLLLRKRLEPLPQVHARELLPKRALESSKRDIKEIEEAIK